MQNTQNAEKDLTEKEIFDLHLTNLMGAVKVLEEQSQKKNTEVLECYRKVFQEFGCSIKRNIGE